MLISFQLSGSQLMHLTPDQYGAFVAHCVKLNNFHSINVERGVFLVTFNIVNLGTQLIDQAKIAQQLQEELAALQDLDPMPCPCGCGMYLLIGPCLKQSKQMYENGLSPEENQLASGGNKIAAIKCVRERLGIGLRDAKDLVDKAYPTKWT